MIKYLYIDDEKDKVTTYIESLSKDSDLSIDFQQAQTLDKAFLLKNLKNYDGVLLDLRTDQEPDEHNNISDFTGAEWGQHLRVLSTNGELDNDVPIVLFSTDAKLQQTYFRDLTSNNIFDRFLSKDKTPLNAQRKLISLANGYKEISKEKDFNKLLKIDTVNLDPRIFSRFSVNDIPAHEYAQMILKDLIYAKGVLINEKYLAARLGIDKESSTDWENVATAFSAAKYKGVFSDGWERWWMFEIDKKFHEISGTYLNYLDAKERIAILKEKLGLANLNYPEPIDKNESYDYWTVCKALGKPLDSHEAFKVYTRSEPKPWQEYEYISLHALLEESPTIQQKNITIHPIDKEKYTLKRAMYNK
ncbi:MAG: hypothetical protein A2W82_06010 [Sulfurimonas sp. RIFCSPLOWO2_12_36_12]|uniref:hypothetical protein n=1 Tax=Sulfurimonas sp. RIFCSPLOWO2_12_36_12 TaxID=1802253 RepID=UPI0008C1899D|nr:hypothetical protein [Sulfurimonas sp. RIFCSPLOWO2_12_36_12]OHE02632.1 MAG: hypothetical protein A2W82_06010 [Sulfurimonas sp. RIFCSPLOWO2_12_36_12]